MTNTTTNVMRQHAEQQYTHELNALKEVDRRQRPPNWELSPWAVATYLLGGTLENGVEITPKYIGKRRIIEIAVATLATDRALLLLGVPGTAEETIRYGWNYAQLLAKGPSLEAVVPSPVMRAMRTGKIARIEELTRIPAEVQDSFISLLSEKILPIPELDEYVQAAKGFNVIATANDRDRGVNELSSALKRRFNTVVLPLPDSADEEVTIVETRVASLGRALELPIEKPALQEIRRIVTIFRELRAGHTDDGKIKLKSPSASMSTAEAISVVTNGMALAAHFGDGTLRGADMASSLIGAVVKDPVQDRLVMLEYLETVVKERDGWKDLYRACRDVL